MVLETDQADSTWQPQKCFRYNQLILDSIVTSQPILDYSGNISFNKFGIGNITIIEKSKEAVHKGQPLSIRDKFIIFLC